MAQNLVLTVLPKSKIMKPKIKWDIKVRKEMFGAIVRIPKNLERVDLPQFYQINQLGLQVLQSCNGSLEAKEIITKVSEEYPNKKIEEIRDDILSFLYFFIPES